VTDEAEMFAEKLSLVGKKMENALSKSYGSKFRFM